LNPNHLSYQNLFWLFMIGCVLGFFIEGVWCRFKYGHWENHPSAVWGPFSCVYGIGAVVIYIVSLYVRTLSVISQFFLFALCGTAVEYVCSWFQEVFLKSSSWDYSTYRFNLHGRVSLRLSLFWGILGTLFAWFVVQPLTSLLQHMTGALCDALCVILSIFMAVDLLITALALLRWRKRLMGTPAKGKAEEWLDRHFGNERMLSLFNNLEFFDLKSNCRIPKAETADDVKVERAQ